MVRLRGEATRRSICGRWRSVVDPGIHVDENQTYLVMLGEFPAKLFTLSLPLIRQERIVDFLAPVAGVLYIGHLSAMVGATKEEMLTYVVSFSMTDKVDNGSHALSRG